MQVCTYIYLTHIQINIKIQTKGGKREGGKKEGRIEGWMGQGERDKWGIKTKAGSNIRLGVTLKG